MRIVKQSVELEWITPDAASVIEKAARTCYKSEDRMVTGSSRFLETLWNRGHHSCFEHASASFRVVCDRGISHEFVRHRLHSYSQESTRFCRYDKDKFSNEITVIQPPGLDDYSLWVWNQSTTEAESRYMELLECGETPEIARSVLPTCLKTEFVATANFRSWLHFLYMRTANEAHPQMREVARTIGEQLIDECPEVFELCDWQMG